MKFVQLIPATDWFVVHHTNEYEPVRVDRIVAWGLDDDGKVTGLVTHSSFDRRDRALIVPMEIDQTKYKHLTELSERELAELQNE